MKSNRKVYFVILLIMAIFFVIVYFSFAKDNLDKEKKEITIVMGNSSVWNLTGNKWINITGQDTIKSLYWKKFNIYLNSKKMGKYYLWYSDKWYLFDDDRNAVKYSGNLVATRGNFDAEFLDVQGENITDYSYVNKVLADNGLSQTNDYTVSSLYSFDFDNDGETEQFYLISNVFSDTSTPDVIFSIIFMVKNSEYKILYNDISKSNGFNGCKPYINGILDVDQDKQYEMILSCGRYSAQTPIDMLYDYIDNEFKIVISNQ